MVSKTRLLFGVLGAAATFVAIAPRAPSANTASSAAIQIDNFHYSPPMLVVAPGTTVTWTNRDDIPHTVVATDKEFRSKALDTKDDFSFTFTTPGSYQYFCSLHPYMKAMVTVE